MQSYGMTTYQPSIKSTQSSTTTIRSGDTSSSSITSYQLQTPGQMIKSPEEKWEMRWSTFQVNPFAILLDRNWWLDPLLNEEKGAVEKWLQKLGVGTGGGRGKSTVQLPSSMGGETILGSFISFEDAFQSLTGQLYDINQAVLRNYNTFAEALQQQQQQQLQQMQNIMGMIPQAPEMEIEIPDVSEALAILQERLGETYTGLREDIFSDLMRLQSGLEQGVLSARGRVMGDLPTLLAHSRAGWDQAIQQARGEISGARGRIQSDLESLLAHRVWEEPIRQAQEIAREEALRFMDVAGIGGLGGSALMMSDIMQEAVQPLLVEKSRGQQALLRGAQEALAGLEQLGVRTLADLLGQKEASATQLLRGTQEILGGLETMGIRGLTELLGGAQAQLGTLGRDYFRMMYELPFEVEKQALAEAGFKYGTALDYFMAQLEPFRIILGAQSSEGVPPSSAEKFWTIFAGLM